MVIEDLKNGQFKSEYYSYDGLDISIKCSKETYDTKIINNNAHIETNIETAE